MLGASFLDYKTGKKKNYLFSVFLYVKKTFLLNEKTVTAQKRTAHTIRVTSAAFCVYNVSDAYDAPVSISALTTSG